MIDAKGFRLNVGIILLNQSGQVFWGKRIGLANAWQFPQGGIQDNETAEEAMHRELTEELGLSDSDVKVLGVTKGWLYYYLPKHMRRYNSKPLCIGQKQKWFLLQLTSSEDHIQLDKSPKPEFGGWRWVDYWLPAAEVIRFKRRVYKAALKQLEPLKNLLK